MDTSKFDVILDAGSESFVDELKKALGLKPDEVLQIITPQFERTDGRKVLYIPKTEREFDAIKLMDKQSLKLIGCGIWDGDETFTHWLYPKEWYDTIPNGYEITDINGAAESFLKGETDDDIRYGCLAYGFIQRHN